MQVHTNLSARLTKFKGEINKKPSETIPDQATTPQELLRRYATGQPLGFRNTQPVYDDDDVDIPELYKMNKMERLHALQDSTENLLEKRSDHIEAINKFQKTQAAKLEKQQKETETTTKTDDKAKPAEQLEE